MEETLTVTEAARELGLSATAVRYRLERGQLAGRRVHSRLWLIPREVVEQAKAAGRLTPGPKKGSKRHPRAGSKEQPS